MRKLIRIIKDKFLELFPGLNYSSYVKDYLFLSNMRSSIFVGSVVSIFEIWMLITVISGAITSDGERDFYWVLKHAFSYIILLLTALAMLVYAILYLKGKIKNKKIGIGIKILFTIIAISFGLYISYVSYDKSGQVFAFITMEAFCLCLLVWQPIRHFVILTLSFGIYLYLQSLHSPLSYSIKVNSFTLWIVLLMAGINTHHQRRLEAQKDENLEKLTDYLKRKSLVDELTGLSNLNYFQRKTMEILTDEQTDISTKRFVFMDIENFKNYNEKYGFRSGNNLLRTVGQIIQATFDGEVVARFSDDHFIAFVNKDDLEKNLSFIKEQILEIENTIQLGLKAGVYTPTDRYVAPSIALDNARYACHSVKKHFSHDVAEYSDLMNSEFKRKQYIINNIDVAIQNEYIKVYYQPVVWAESGRLCSTEALARWNDPEYGFLSPAEFIPILEEYHQIHKLDMFVMKTVCKDIHESYENNTPVIPVSINFSRLDFELADPVKEVSECVEKYKISKNDIHIEITESALLETDYKLQDAMNDLRSKGFSLWLDDFGSGYSGLNVLKDFSFDMMKIDMKFLSKFSENKKTQPILASIISLAKQIGMQTLTEGVETPEACEFLRSIGCQRLQGYLFGKPMPKEELLKKIESGELKM